ncbi:MAG: hypothetical protein RI947_86 [Candidatus Parcubacteria bacterium]|jgi:hypothetical protein
MSKKLIYSLAFLVFALSTAVSYWYFNANADRRISFSILDNSKPSPIVDKSGSKANGDVPQIDSSEPRTEECPLNGEMLTKAHRTEWETRRPLGVMIENHKEARPQSGLSIADVVYEAVAEGGITRFMAVFYCKDAPYVGPVRSARMYFIRFLEEYGQFPLYAHVGGANTPGPADALGEIRELGWNFNNDMNQFSVPFPVYYRDYDRLPDRATEHTVYSSTQKLWNYAKTKRALTNVDADGLSWDKGFVPWEFKDNAKPEERGTVNKVSFGFWNAFSSDFSVDWNYDKSTNSYTRVNGGVSHKDKNTGKPLRARNIVVIFAKESPANDGYDGGHLIYKNTGTGDAIIFQDGNAIKGTWSKKDAETRMSFTDEKGKKVSFVRGQIFIEMLPIGNKVTY